MTPRFLMIGAVTLFTLAAQAQAGSTSIKSGTNLGTDASGGVMAQADTSTTLEENDARARLYDESDSRTRAGGGSNVDMDTSAGGDENAALRASIRNRDDGSSIDPASPNASTRINANAAANSEGSLFGLSTGTKSQLGSDSDTRD